MSSNINAILDKVEDPAKMIDQYLRNLNSDLGKVKAETAAIMAEEKRSKRELDQCQGDMVKMQAYAVKALEAGNEEDARKFLENKAILANKEADLAQSYTLANANAVQMRQMHDKLVSDIGALEARQDMIKGKIAVAKTQERINQLGSSVNQANSSMAAFDRMEQKANKALDKANAMAELNARSQDDIEDLAAKYARTTNVDSELEALKASIKKEINK